MKKIIGASIAVVIGVVGISVFFSAFADLLAGFIPLLLILGGGLAIYIEIESRRSEVTDNVDNTTSTEPSQPGEVPETPAESTASQPAQSRQQAAEKDDQKAKDTQAQFIGNTESRVFHSTDCKFASSKNCTASFSTREAAIAEGYKPCATCTP